MYYEKKFRDPDGIIFDLFHLGWVAGRGRSVRRAKSALPSGWLVRKGVHGKSHRQESVPLSCWEQPAKGGQVLRPLG